MPAKLRTIRRSARRRAATHRTVLAFGLTLLAVSAPAQTITTVAGGGPGSGPATQRPIGWPYHVGLDAAGNRYIATGPLGMVVQVSPGGVLTVVAGNGGSDSNGDGGPATSASLMNPAGVAYDTSTTTLYISESGTHKIRKVDSGGTITTIAGNGFAGSAGDGGPAASAFLNGPRHLALAGGFLYIADTGNHRIRRIQLSTGTITLVAGSSPGYLDGPAGTARFNQPNGVAVNGSGDVFVADTLNHVVRRVSAGSVTTVAGIPMSAGYNGEGSPATSFQLFNPEGVAVDGSSNVYIADETNFRIRRLSGTTISTVAGGTSGFGGDLGPPLAAAMNRPHSVAVDPGGNLHIADTFNSRLRVVSGGIIDTVAGNGTLSFGGDGGLAVLANLFEQKHVSLDPGGHLLVGDERNARIRRVNTATGVINTVAGTGLLTPFNDGVPALSANLRQPYSATMDSAGNLYIADTVNNRVRKVDTGGTLTTIAGTGTGGYNGDGSPATSFQLNTPTSVAVDAAGNVFIADNGNNRVRMVTPGGVISTLAGTGTGGYNGDGSPANTRQLWGPYGVAVDASGDVFIADSTNCRIRKVDTGGAISTVAGSGPCGFLGDGGAATGARLNFPKGVAVDGAGNILIADSSNHRVRMVEERTGRITTVAGGSIAGFMGDGGPATAARLNQPFSVAVNSAGRVFVSDSLNSRVRAMTLGTDLEVTKTDGQVNDVPGTTVQYTLRVTNHGPNTVNALNLVDNPPPTLTITGYNNFGVGLYVPGTGEWTGLDILPGGFVDLQVDAIFSSSATGNVVNTAVVAPPLGLTDPNPLNDQGQDTTFMTPQADVSILKSDSPDPATVGMPLTYTLNVFNNGPSDATNVLVTDNLPPGVTFNFATGPCSFSGVVTCNLGTIAAGSGHAPLQITVTPTQPGTLVNTANVQHGPEPDTDGSNDNATATTVVIATRVTGSMATPRAGHTATLLQNGKVLVVGGEVGVAAYTATVELYDPATGLWSPALPLAAARAWHTATLLPNGKVLVAGGFDGTTTLGSAEMYDPVSGTWAPAGTLSVARMHHAATLLRDGGVLFTGGFNTLFGPQGSVERYDSASGWTFPLGMVVPHYQHTATLLADGKVLVAGGVGENRSEIYDPMGGPWVLTPGTLTTPRARHTATLLPNGKVLVTGGIPGLNTAELFDPGPRTWALTASMSGFRTSHTATLLPNGKVLVAGSTVSPHGGTSDVYDPATFSWSPGPGLQAQRSDHTATLLPDGRVLLAGGQDTSASAYLASSELFAVTGAFSATGGMSMPRYLHTTTLLPNGKVLAAGDSFSSAPTELYDFGTGMWMPTPSGMITGRRDHTATLLVNGKVLAAGGFGATSLNKAELFDPLLTNWTATGDLNLARSGHSATLLPDGTVLVAGGLNGTCVGQPERYRPLSGTWDLLPAMPACRFEHAAVLLGNGKVLVIGGTDDSLAPLATSDVYDPGSGTWTPQGNLIMARRRPAATLLADGRVLVVSGTEVSSLAEIYDPGSGSWSSAGNMTAPRLNASATLLPGGQVLVVGGSSSTFYRKTAEIFDPATSSWTPTGDLAQTRASHTAVFLPNGKVLVVGGTDGVPPGRSGSELYDPGLGYLVAWQPLLSGAMPDPLVEFNALTAMGVKFRGVSESSGGQGAQDSSTDYPLLQLRRLDNSALRWVPADPTMSWTDTTFHSPALTGLVPGEALVTVFTNGIPGISRTVTVECPAPSFNSTPGNQAVCAGSTVQFSASVNAAFPEFQWRRNGIPLADGGRITGSHTDTLQIANVDFTDNGMYDVVVSLACSSVMITSLPPASLMVQPALTAVTATPPGPFNVCQYSGCTGGNILESHVGGGTVTYQWGFRTSPGGPVNDIPGATLANYLIRGTDFPGPGTYYVVVRTTPTCGAPLTSNNVVVTVDNTGLADTVRYLTVTSKDGQNVVQWLNPMLFGSVRIRYNSDPVSCVYPTSPDGFDGSMGPFDVPGAPDQPARLEHNGLTNGDYYCYTAWVNTGAPWSAGKHITGRPFTVPAGAGPKWGFNTGIFSMVPPGNGVGVVYSVAQDGTLHAMIKGSGAQSGTWPGIPSSLPVWKPQKMNGPSQGRPSGIPVPTAGSTRTIFLSSQDGHVYAFNAETGAPGWSPSSPSLVPAPELQAHPAGVFTMFGGSRDLIFVGTRDPLGAKFYALRLVDGDKVPPGWEFSGGAFGKIGAINGQAAVDQVAKRVYFASREFDPANNKTVWCLDLETGVPCTGFAPQAYGHVDTAVSLSGGLLFVGSNNTAGTDPRVRAIRTSDGGEAWNYPISVAGEGAPKGYIAVDRLTGDSYFSTTNRVWALDAGGLPKWSCSSLTEPSIPLYAPGDAFVYVGAADGKLHRLQWSGGSEDTTAPFPIPLGDGTAAVGSPTYDLLAHYMYVGSEDGIVYAVQLP